MYAATYSTLKSCVSSACISAAEAMTSSPHSAKIERSALRPRSARCVRPAMNATAPPHSPMRSAIHRAMLPSLGHVVRVGTDSYRDPHFASSVVARKVPSGWSRPSTTTSTSSVNVSGASPR